MSQYLCGAYSPADSDCAGQAVPPHAVLRTPAWRMGGEGLSGMRGIARLLTTRPAEAAPAPGDPTCGGAPFELPYTLAIPDDEHTRRRYLSLLDSSALLTADLAAAGETGDLVDERTGIDVAARAVVKSLLAAG